MHQQSIAVSPSVEIFIEQVNGDLRVKGWDRPEALIRADNEEDFSITKEGDVLRLNCRNDCSIRLPFAANIHIGHVQGNARFKYLENRLQINQVDGSVVLRNVPEVQLTTVNGDLMAKLIAGNITIEQVLGDVFINQLEKNCSIQKVSGRLHLHDVKGDISAAAQGHAYLRLNQPTLAHCEIKSQGDIHCQMPEDLHAQVILKSGASYIQVQLANKKQLIVEQETHLTIGEGKAQLTLSAEGKIFFSSQDYDWQAIGDFEAGFDNDFHDISKSYIQQMETQFEKQMDLLNDHMGRLSETLSGIPLPGVEVERMVERARQSSVIAAQRAQEKMQRAQKKMEIKLETARRKSDKAARHSRDRSTFHIQWDVKPKTSTSTEEKVTEDERLVILRMLEQKKISLEEAENLLRALEGEEG